MLKLISLVIFLPWFFSTDTMLAYCDKSISPEKQGQNCRETKTTNNCTLKTCCYQESSTSLSKCTRCLKCCDDNGCNTNCTSD